MNWRGKAIGGSIGSMFGPWGAVAGAAVGHYFIDRDKPPVADPKQGLRLLALTAGALYELARADGRYTPRKDAVIRRLLEETNLRLGTGLRPHELAYLVDDATRIDRSLMRLATAVNRQSLLARLSAVSLWRLAVCEGDSSAPVAEAVAGFCRAAGLEENEALRLAVLYRRSSVAAADPARRAACGVLGLPYQADAAQIKAAYRAQSVKYHPDKHAGLDPDIRALTAEKFGQIKAAYDTLCGRASASGGEWFVRRGDTGQLAPAADSPVILCFLCGGSGRIPSQEELASARCPVCQALLAFDRETAGRLV